MSIRILTLASNSVPSGYPDKTPNCHQTVSWTRKFYTVGPREVAQMAQGPPDWEMALLGPGPGPPPALPLPEGLPGRALPASTVSFPAFVSDRSQDMASTECVVVLAAVLLFRPQRAPGFASPPAPWSLAGVALQTLLPGPCWRRWL